MRVYISVDMEGIGGISHPHPTDAKDTRYAASVALMVGETNAAIDGALAAGATDILVNDSHSSMYNLLPEDVHQAARVLQGEKAWSMVAGALPGADGTPTFDVALFVGYHAGAGDATGVIAHTYSSATIMAVRVNGEPHNEAALNAIRLGHHGIPVALVAGDDALAREVGRALPWAERVVVKRGLGYATADSLRPEAARTAIREGVARALGRLDSMRPYAPEPPIRGEVDFRFSTHAAYAAVLPEVERSGPRTVTFAVDDGETFYRRFLAVQRLAAAPGL